MGRMEDIEIWEVFYWSLNSTLSSGLRCFGLICLIWAGHYLSSSLGPTCPSFSVFCPDWPHMIDAEKNPPRHLPILYWLRHWPTTRGSHRDILVLLPRRPEPGELYYKMTLSWQQSNILQHYDGVRHFPLNSNTTGQEKETGVRVISGSISSYSRVWIFCQYFDTSRQFDGV